MDFSMIGIILGCVILLLFIGKIFSFPLRMIMKLTLNSILGGILIFLINLVGSAFGFHIGLNIFTSILVGILGVPRCSIVNFVKNFHIKLSEIKKKQLHFT